MCDPLHKSIQKQPRTAATAAEKTAAVEQRKKQEEQTEEQRQPPPTSMMTRMRTTGCVNPKMSEKYITNAEQPEQPQDNHPTFLGR